MAEDIEPLRAFGACGPAFGPGHEPGPAGDAAALLYYLGRRTQVYGR